MPVHPSLPIHNSWFSYSGSSAAFLAVALVAVALAFAYAGMQLRTPVAIRRPGPAVSGFMIAIWGLAIVTYWVAVRVYGMQMRQTHLLFMPPKVKVGTFLYALVTFVVIFLLTRRHGWKVALGSAFVGTAAAPMFFELPFDLIVMPMINPPIPPNPWLYRALFFFPLFMIEVSTIALLSLSPPVRITRYACFALAAMFAVFAVWAAYGFDFPARPLPLALNIVSKILCFVAGVMLFVQRPNNTTVAG